MNVVRTALVTCLVVSFVVPVVSQNRVIWKASVMPERIAVYESNSTESRIINTLDQGDIVDVIFEANVSGTEWCRVARDEASEPLGFVLCLNLGKGPLVSNQNLRVEAATLAVAPAPVPLKASNPSVLTNKDILELQKAGLPQQVVVAKIKSSQCNFDTSPSQLSQLKSAGLADSVILAMVEASAPASAAPPVNVPAMAHRKIVLEDNTPVHLVLSDNLSSASATTGQTISFEVSEDVIVEGIVVVPRESLAWGTVTDAQAKRRLGRAGHLDVNIDKVRLADGEKVLLSATSHAKGASHTAGMTAGIVATSLVVWPAAPFFLFMHGHDVTIPKGTKIEAFINGDVTLDAANFVSSSK